MYVALSLVEPPAEEPVAAELARRHCRIDYEEDDDLLATYITAARTLAEDYLDRALVTQQLAYSVSEAPPGPQWPLTAVTPVILPLWLPYPLVFQAPIRLPRSPVQSIDKVQVSHNGQLTDQVLDAATDYTSDITASPGRLLISPAMQPQLGQHVIITYTAGYESLAAIPPAITLAILFGTAWFYEHRGDEIGRLPQAFYDLLTPNRLVGFG